MRMRGTSGETRGASSSPAQLGRKSDSLDARDRLRVAQRSDDRVQVREVVHFDVQMEGLEAAVTVDQLKVDDVRVLCPEDARHGAESAGDVAEDDREARRAAVRAFAPRKIE